MPYNFLSLSLIASDDMEFPSKVIEDGVNELSRLPGVTRLKSSFALREVASRPLPASSLKIGA